MATKTEIMETGNQQAALIVNNSLIDGLTHQLNEKIKYGMQFPADYNIANALMGAYLTLKETADKNGKPLLEACSQVSVANSLMDMATMGLNVQKKQGYFIAYGGKCAFQKSYFGNITIARRYGLKSINADIIYKGDVFKYHKYDAMTIIDTHEQSFENIDNDNILGAYAVAVMEDGSKVSEVMNIKQIRQSWQQGFGYKDGSGTHAKFTDQMAKKTVINRLCKLITNTYGDAFVSDAYDKAEDFEQTDLIAEDVRYEIAQNANQTEFQPVAAIEERELPETVADVTAGKKEKEAVKAEKKEQAMPGFMQTEG